MAARTDLAGLDSFSAFTPVLDESLTNLPVVRARKRGHRNAPALLNDLSTAPVTGARLNGLFIVQFALPAIFVILLIGTQESLPCSG